MTNMAQYVAMLTLNLVVRIHPLALSLFPSMREFLPDCQTASTVNIGFHIPPLIDIHRSVVCHRHFLPCSQGPYLPLHQRLLSLLQNTSCLIPPNAMPTAEANEQHHRNNCLSELKPYLFSLGVFFQ